MRRAKLGWSSKFSSPEFWMSAMEGFPRRNAPGRTDKANDDVDEETRCQPVQPEGSGGGHQSRDQGREGRQKHVVRRAGGCGRRGFRRGGLRIRQGQRSSQAIRKGIESAKKNLVRVHLTETTIP